MEEFQKSHKFDKIMCYCRGIFEDSWTSEKMVKIVLYVGSRH